MTDPHGRRAARRAGLRFAAPATLVAGQRRSWVARKAGREAPCPGRAVAVDVADPLRLRTISGSDDGIRRDACSSSGARAARSCVGRQLLSRERERWVLTP